MDDGGSCGFAYNVKTGLSAGNLENVAFVDKDEELSLRFKYDGVTYAMDFPEESYQEIYGRMIYNCTFVSSDDRECLGMLIKTDEAYGSATGTVRFCDDIASDEAFSFVIAPNSSVLEDYRDALEERENTVGDLDRSRTTNSENLSIYLSGILQRKQRIEKAPDTKTAGFCCRHFF